MIDVQKQKTHGGSMRYVIARKGEYRIKNVVSKSLKSEKNANIDKLKGCLDFKKNARFQKRN